MPRYQYQCECKNIIVEFRPIDKRNDPVVCPKCKKLMDRLIGASIGLVFKGEGFYCNDYPKEETNGKEE